MRGVFMFDRPYLRASEAAVFLGIGRGKMYDLIHKGEIPSVMIGGSIRVPADRLRAIIESRMTNAEKPEAPTPVAA